MNSTKQPTVRAINSHVWCGQAYCYVDLPDGRRLRISRARTRKGVVEGLMNYQRNESCESGCMPAAKD